MSENYQIEQINAGITLKKIEDALKTVAIGVVNNDVVGTVTVKFDIKPQKGSETQVNIVQKVSFKKPTPLGDRSETINYTTPMFVSRSGLMAIPEQPCLNFDNDENITELKTKGV